ncbi:hypothetical protein AB5I41_21295 [Sphingomonas sp. MMS24-JH45]
MPLLIVGDGKALTFIDYSVRQVQRWPIGNSPLACCSIPNRDISRYAKVLAPSANSERRVGRGRSPKHPEYGRITLVLAQLAHRRGPTSQGWVASQPGQSHHHPTRGSAVQRAGERRNFRWNDRRTGSRRLNGIASAVHAGDR